MPALVLTQCFGPHQAAVVHETGPASALKIETAWPVPAIADGQVLVKNEYAGINFIDTYHRSGLYKRDLPFVGGQEGGGKIAALTPKVIILRVGAWESPSVR
jgi:NADPH2:quinone reductase